MQKTKFDISFEQIYLEAKAHGKEARLEDELFSFTELIRKKYDFKLFLEDPRISSEYKKVMLEKLCTEKMTHDFFAVIHAFIDTGREELIEEFSNAFTKKFYKENGVLFGQVTSVYKIPEKLRKRLESAMQKRKKGQVKFRYSIDPELLGGICIKFINGEVWDISLKHKIDEVKHVILK